jgi:hypothetical protein
VRSRSLSPCVPVLWPIVNEKEDGCSRKALNQSVEEDLSRGIYSVEVLEYDKQGPLLARLEDEIPESFHDAPLAQRWIQALPCEIVDWHVDGCRIRRRISSRRRSRDRTAGTA